MRTVKLAELAANKRWAINGGPFGSKLVSKDYRDEGVPVIRGANLPDSSWFSDDKLVFVSEEKADELLANNAHPGDVIFTQRGTLGQVGLIPLDSPYERYVISQSQMKMTVDRSIADPRWLYYYFRQESIVESIKARAVTSGVPHINLGTLKDFEIALPDLKTQEATADCLMALDGQLENHRKQISLLEEAARLIYTEWFVRLRFPGQKKKSLTWPIKPLKTIAEINAESLGKQNHWDTLLYVDISSVSPGLVEQKTEYLLPDAPGRAKRLVAHGDIIWSCVRPNRRSHALILNPEENLVVSTGFATIRSKAVPWTYLYLALTTDAFVAYLESNAQGAAYPAVTGRDFEKAEILVPPPDVLEQFDQLAKPIFEQIETLKSQIEKLRQARDLLLPRLIAGQLRL